MKPAVHVRMAEPGDVGALAGLTERGVRRGVGAASDELSANFLSLLDCPQRFVLSAVDERSADVVGVLVASEGETDAVAPASALTISFLRVKASHRRRGAGRALLAAAVRQAEARGLDQVIAAVASNDRDANRYLARLGFAPQVIRRSSPTSTLRRTLGLSELEDRELMRRRLVARSMHPVRVAHRGA